MIRFFLGALVALALGGTATAQPHHPKHKTVVAAVTITPQRLRELVATIGLPQTAVCDPVTSTTNQSVCLSINATTGALLTTLSAGSAATAQYTNNQVYNGTSWENWRTAAGITGGSAPTGLGAVGVCNAANSGGQCGAVYTPSQGSGVLESLFTTSYLLASDNSSASQFDPVRKDTYANGPLWVTTGGSATATVAAASAGPNVIKAAAGRLARVIITTAGTTGTDIFYDNASACSGTIIGEIAGTTASAINVAGGVPFQLDMPAANGITECGGTGSAAVTVSYY
jgi:hypothetical protein